MKNLIFIPALLLVLTIQIFPQQYLEKELQTTHSPEEMVSLSATLPFSQAIALLSKVSERITGKRIISTVQIDTATGIEIKNMYYFRAFVALVKMAGLIYEERPDIIVVKRSTTPEIVRTKDNYVSATAREIKISAIFFEADLNKERQLGINWQAIFNNGTSNVGGTLNTFTPSNTTTSGTTSTTVTPDFNLNATTNFNVGGFYAQATAVFKFFENENVGDIISSPNITVLDGSEARLQDGQDLSIKQKDFSGNIIDNFYSIGSIVGVTPYVISEDSLDYILLKIHVERSSFVPDPTNTIINKTSADTRVVLLDGEETVIGGMYIDQTTVVRQGVPFLKDLPWWFFGLRYIFGYDDNSVSKKELVILIKASLVPGLKDRFAGPQSKNPLKDELQYQRDKIKYYQFNQQNNNDR